MKKMMLVVAVLSWMASAVQVGEKSPEFTLKGADGKTYELKQFLGKTVVLEWFNEGCPFVAKHYSSKNMQNLQKEYTGKGVIWFSILSSAPGKQGHVTGEQLQKDMTRLQAQQTASLLDPTGEVGKKYGAKTTPHFFIINPKGEVAYQGAIDDNSSADPESIKGAKSYVKEALDAILSNKSVPNSTTKPYGCSVKYAS